ncbi:MAG TPA: hypothetical protein VK284_09455 [Streptosporangiaceae bacterium]|jgi:hypothetical protein|nr:hypothetical protein [Streptosporangiaceae bacterium]
MTAAAGTIDQAAGELEDTAEGKNRLGRALDVAGICAGVVLGVILFDIFSGGKLTQWARNRRGPGPGGDAKPGGCEGCGDDN